MQDLRFVKYFDQYMIYGNIKTFQVVSMVKHPPANAGGPGDQVCSLGLEDPLEEGMTTHSGIHAWRIPWTEEPGGLQSIGSQRVGHD